MECWRVLPPGAPLFCWGTSMPMWETTMRPKRAWLGGMACLILTQLVFCYWTFVLITAFSWRTPRSSIWTPKVADQWSTLLLYLQPPYWTFGWREVDKYNVPKHIVSVHCWHRSSLAEIQEHSEKGWGNSPSIAESAAKSCSCKVQFNSNLLQRQMKTTVASRRFIP